MLELTVQQLRKGLRSGSGRVRLDPFSTACSPTRVFLVDELGRVGEHDGDRRFLLLMCRYAGHVARGELPGLHSDCAVRRFAWACLIPAELLERAALDVERAAHALGVPARELAAARAAHVTAAHVPRWLRHG